MKDRFGAPGTGLSRHRFLATIAGVGTAALAGCQSLLAQVNVRSGSKVNHVMSGNVYPGEMFPGLSTKVR
ncbi:hypothetical protein DEQ92_20040 [Haloferax sp. Atlit-6N]|nr:hypothetical protein DEQ92_20040 [Haloferax sp. Atlit-6N]